MELFIIFIPIALWIASIYLLFNWDGFNRFFLINLLLVIAYIGFLTFGKSLWGHDEYGLGFLSRLIMSMLVHVLSVFIFAIVKSRQLKYK